MGGRPAQTLWVRAPYLAERVEPGSMARTAPSRDGLPFCESTVKVLPYQTLFVAG